MVLDGQQRAQSLLLAVRGDEWGLKLTDRSWTEALGATVLRGRRSAKPSWTRGQLCLNVNKYLAASTADSPRQIDYVPVLEWVNTLSADDVSPTSKVPSKSALLKLSNLPGEYVRLSRLWRMTDLPRQEDRVVELEQILASRKSKVRPPPRSRTSCLRVL
jgi:hypothetical protein